MREVATGVWHWEARHPDWAGPENQALRERITAMPETPSEAAHGVVSSYAVDDGERLLLFDPLVVPREIEELAAAREPVVVLSAGERRNSLRRRLNTLVAAHHHRTDLPHGKIHAELRRLCGGPPSAQATIEQLEERIATIQTL